MASGARGFLWGWSLPARLFLATVALVCATALAWATPRFDGDLSLIGPALEVDPNTASPGILLALPRLGPALVKRVVAARERRLFRSLDDFDRRVSGIGPATVAALRPHLRFEPETTAVLAPKSGSH